MVQIISDVLIKEQQHGEEARGKRRLLGLSPSHSS
jgi:hypothetical protein